jgi:hypothetical protein
MVTDIDHAVRDAKLNQEERSTLVKLIVEKMTDTRLVPERLRQPVINRGGRLFVKRQLDPALWFKWVRRKIDWRDRLAEGM